jgi:hypothetical protein
VATGRGIQSLSIHGEKKFFPPQPELRFMEAHFEQRAARFDINLDDSRIFDTDPADLDDGLVYDPRRRSRLRRRHRLPRCRTRLRRGCR